MLDAERRRRRRIARWFAAARTAQRQPGRRDALWRMNAEIDVRDVLPSIRVPDARPASARRPPPSRGRTLRGPARARARASSSWRAGPPSLGRGLASRASTRSRTFLTGASRRPPSSSRVLATVLFTDSSARPRGAELGDRRWRDLLESITRSSAAQLGRFRGREVDTAGDGFFATFDGPARAIRCAQCDPRGGRRSRPRRSRRPAHGRMRGLGREGRRHRRAHRRAGRRAGGGRRGARLATVKDLVAGSGLRSKTAASRAQGRAGGVGLYAVEGVGG